MTAATAAVDARVLGRFQMLARVTAAEGVPGEHVGQRLRRTWTVSPRGCTGSVCSRLVLLRGLGRGRHERLVLSRTGRGRWAGRGSFWVALRCRGRVYRHGSLAPYRLTLQVSRAVEVEGVRFARAVTATYLNTARTDRTPCPLGPSHDAARYDGRAVSALPAPPAASFTDTVDPADRTAAFTDTSHPGTGGAAVVAWSWNFGDPSTGPADTSTQADPSHTFSAPGSYVVALTVTDTNGLTGRVTGTVVVPGVPPAASPRRG